MIRKLMSLLVAAGAALWALTAQAVVQVDIEHDTSGVRLGYWTSDFDAAKAMADKEHIPMVGFWGSAGCGYCALMKSTGLISTEFLDWVKTHKIIMCYVEVPADRTSVMTPAKEFIKGRNNSGLYPFMTFYWNKADGSQVKVDFSGRKGSIPPFSKGTTGAQFVAGLNNYFGSYKPQPPVETYTGGYFTVTNNTADARLEALVGKTAVNVPLRRTATAAGSNKLEVAGGATTEVSWAANVTSQVVKVALPANAAAGTKVALKLYAADGKTVKSSTVVNVVNEPAVSLTNPKWIGESFAAGEWTMDLDAALAKAGSAAVARTYTLAYSSGVLWCPYCASLEQKVLSNAKFAAWAKDHNVNLVLLDNPKRSDSDVKDANGNVTSVGTKADGAAPTLLRYEVGSNGKSGAAYLTRKGIATGNATTKGTAEYVLQRNHDLLYKGGKLAMPEAMRTGYPTFILVNPDGTVAANLLDACDGTTKTWGISLEETLDRLTELLKLEGATPKFSKPSTTPDSLSIEDGVDGELQVNDNVHFVKLTNVPAGKVTFTGHGWTRSQQEAKLQLTVYETSSTLAQAKKIASGTGTVAATFTTGANKYLAVSYYTDPMATVGTESEVSYWVESRVTLVPSEAAATFTSASGAVDIVVTAGKKYKLSGFADYSAFTKNADGTYTPKASGTLTLKCKGTVSFQLWVPGSVQFTTTSASKMESDGSGTVTVARTGGASGAATVTVSVDKGSNGSGRVTVSPATLTWADGVSGSKTVTYKINASTAFNPDETFALTLAKSGTTDVALGANVKFTLKVSDSDDPIFANAKNSVRCFAGVETAARYAISNIRENKNVTLAKTGTLPTGLRLSYDAASKAMLLSGKPTRAGTYTFTVAVTEKRTNKTVTGAAATFTVTVVDAKKLQPGEPGYNPVITAGKTIYGSIPVYGKLGGKSVLAGVATLKAYRSGRVTVAYKGTDGSRGSYSGALSLDTAGTAQLTSERGSEKMVLRIDSKGKAKVSIDGLANRFGAALASDAAGYNLFNGSYGSYAGYYTVTLPANVADLATGKETIPTGTGYVILKMNTSSFQRTGKVSYVGMLADGRTFSGSAYLSGVMSAKNGAQWAFLPVSVAKGGAGVGAVLAIRKDAAATHGEDPQVVLAGGGAVPFFLDGNDFTSLNVYGGFYDRTLDFTKCCEDFYETTTFKFVSETTWFAPSEQYGAIKVLPRTKVSVAANDSFVVTNDDRTHPVTLRLSKTTGIVTGRMSVTFANGRKSSLSIRGAVLVGWTDCGCSDSGAAVIERPIFSGTAYYNDRVSGASFRRSFAVELKP